MTDMLNALPRETSNDKIERAFPDTRPSGDSTYILSPNINPIHKASQNLDSDEDAMSACDNDYEIEALDDEGVNFNEVKEGLLLNNALSGLRQRLRRLIRQPPLEIVNEELLYGLSGQTGNTQEAEITVTWDIPGYISEELEEGQTLEKALVLCGGVRNAWATSCSNYVQWRWSDLGLRLLEFFKTCIQQSCKPDKIEDDTLSKFKSETLVVSPRYKVQNNPPSTPISTLVIKAYGTTKSLTELSQQLMWLSTVLRRPRTGHLTVSNADFRCISYGRYQLRLLELEPITEKAPVCWHSLFGSGVIASEYPIPERRNEVGIEIPLQLMLRLARVLSVATYEGGVILNGFSTLLFPTSFSSSPSVDSKISDSVQWHLVSNKQPGLPVDVGDELAKHWDHWVRIADVITLAKARTFLGYCKVAQICLGSESMDYSTIDYSSLRDDQPNPEVSIRSATFGTSGLGFFGAELEAGIDIPRSIGMNVRLDSFDDILVSTRESPVLLYDAEEKQAWLVPMICVILHMVQTWIVKNTPSAKLPFVQPHWDAGQTAWETLNSNYKHVLRISKDNDQPYYLRDLVTRLWADINGCLGAIYLDIRKPRGTKEIGRPRLRGWEFLDIVNRSPTYRMREETLDFNGCGWNLLAEDVMVLVCKGLGTVIRPADSVTICPEWSPVRPGMKYLTASIVCLQQLSKRRGWGETCTRLTDRAYWPPPGLSLFENCSHGSSGRCFKKPQELKEVSKLPASQMEPPPKEGAVIFGKSQMLKQILPYKDEGKRDDSGTKKETGRKTWKHKFKGIDKSPSLS
jgi:hypothetical protein